MAQTTTTRQTADERRVAVLEAATVEFALRGLHGASTDAIARRAGISQPYLFRLFGSKKELFLAVIEGCLARTLDSFRAAASGKSGAEALAAIAATYADSIENDKTIDACGELGIGMIAFSPLAQGILSGKYNTGDTDGARGTSNNPFLKAANIRPETLDAVGKLATIAKARGQSLPQLALAWVLRRKEMTSALIGVRTLAQLHDNLGALQQLDFSADELTAIEAATTSGMMDGKPRWK